ncbi:MAG: class I SAM-dependent methyltransferase [Acidobacteriaceae bacterium]
MKTPEEERRSGLHLVWQHGEMQPPRKKRAVKPAKPHPFDVRFGVETDGLIKGVNLAIGHPHDEHNTAYYGVQPSLFHEVMDRWERTPPLHPLENYTFVDFGAGKGRAMMLASEFPFREVVGVELNPRLAAIAQTNIDLWESGGQALSPMRVVCGDAAEFEFPAGPCVAYLFNPFARPVLRRLIQKMEQSFTGRPGELDLLYVNDECESSLRLHRGFAQLWKGRIDMSVEDEVAELITMNAQEDGEYASSGWERCSAYRWVGRAGEGI